MDSRESDSGAVTRRRRECVECHRRFTTYERVEGVLLSVVKKSGKIEPFESGKIRAGIAIACEKRPVTVEQIDEMVLAVENSIRDEYDSEVSSQEIGRQVMEQLLRVDHVAFVRFASVYQEFSDVGSFVDTVERLHDDRDGEEEGRVT